MENSKIEWTDHTVNLWWGCAKVHTGCKNCYAEFLSDKRYKNGLWGEKNGRKYIKSAFSKLDKFQRQAKKNNEYQKVFIGSMMDIFEPPKELINVYGFSDTGALRDVLFENISHGKYSNLIFLFLTKRPENIVKYVPTTWLISCPYNCYFGTSVSNMETWGKAVELSQIPVNRFLSIEPQVGLIENVDLTPFDWIIQGGESGINRRPFDLNWAYKMRDMCKEQNVPYFFKQIDKIRPIPVDLMIRQFPEAWDESRLRQFNSEVSIYFANYTNK